MPRAAWAVYVDWDNDGDYSDSGEDITAYVRSISWRMGKDRASTLTGQTVSLSFSIELINTDGRFNSFLASGPYYGNLLPGRRVKCTSTYAGTTSTQFVGFISSIQPQPTLGGGHTAAMTGMGPLGKIREQSASIEIQENKDTGALIGVILDAIGWPSGDREIDAGATVVPYYYANESTNVLDLIRDLEASEGGCIYETKDGKIGFESRMRRRVSPYGTSQATLSDAAGAPLGYSEISQADPIEEIFNRATATVKLHQMQPLAVLWTLRESGESSPDIAPGGSRTFWGEISSDFEAVKTWTTPVASTDFLANSKADGTGTDLNAGITVAAEKFSTSMKITLTNGSGSTAYVTLP